MNGGDPPGGMQGDAFDQPAFNAVEYFNRLFPDEAALSQLEGAVAELQVRVSSVESALLNSVRTQALTGGRVSDEMQRARGTMQEVFRSVTEIKQRAEHSEAMVNGICRDIRALDNAKRNITQSIKTVRRMQMLESALVKLQALSREDNFKEAAPLVHATQQLFLNFADRPDVPSLQQMAAQFTAIRTELTSKVMHRFPAYDPTVDGPPPPDMTDGCAVIDAVGGEAPKQFMKAFIQNQLEKYSRKFHRGESNAQLCNTDKRYQWFRRYLDVLAEHCPGVFPPEWCLPQEMAVEFCLLTHQQLSQQIQDEAQHPDVPALVKALQRSQQFERDLSIRFHVPGAPDDDSEEESSGRAAEVARIKQKYMNRGKPKAAAEKPPKVTSPTTQDRPLESSAQYKFYGFITSCFDSSMQLYVDYEDQQMKETIDRLIAEETWGSAEEEGPLGENEILTSASDLFIYIEEGLKRSGAISRAGTVFRMHRVWAKNLAYYAERLGAALTPGKGQERGERVVCLIINTADYWSGILEQLANEIRGKVEEISRNEVNVDPASEAFSLLISKAIRALIRAVEVRMEPHFTEMLRLNWGQVAIAEDQSPYASALCQVMADRMAVVVLHLSAGYLRLFCTKFTVYFLRRFVAQLYKCRRISEPGCQQLFIDVQHLRQKLQDLPNEGNASRFTGVALASYHQLLNAEVKKAENVLKVLMAPPWDKNLPGDYAELAPHPSIPDFVKLMELKGLKKSEIAPLVEQLNQNRKVAKMEHVYADEDLDLQPQDLGGGGSVFGEWKRRIGGRIGDMKHPSLPEYMKIGDLSRAGTQFLGRSHASQAAS